MLNLFLDPTEDKDLADELDGDDEPRDICFEDIVGDNNIGVMIGDMFRGDTEREFGPELLHVLLVSYSSGL